MNTHSNYVLRTDPLSAGSDLTARQDATFHVTY
jgi:hypothetical protein